MEGHEHRDVWEPGETAKVVLATQANGDTRPQGGVDPGLWRRDLIERLHADLEPLIEVAVEIAQATGQYSYLFDTAESMDANPNVIKEARYQTDQAEARLDEAKAKLRELHEANPVLMGRYELYRRLLREELATG